MRKLYFVLTFFVMFFIISTAFVSMKFHSKNSGGVAGLNGSPGEGTCSGCHGGGPSNTTVTINSNPAFVGNEYAQGQTYTITISLSSPSYTRFGFTTEILNSVVNTNAGVMANAGSGVKFLTLGNGRKNAVHSTPKTGAAGTADFVFEWTAPSNGNAVTIYAVGNCVNGNGSTSGDFARTTQLTLTTPTVATVKEQSLNSFQAFHVFPNPVLDKINVSYNLSDPKHIKIQLLSMNGSVVSELLDEDQENGVYSQRLNVPADLASGVYFLKVMADNKIVAQRLVSIR